LFRRTPDSVPGFPQVFEAAGCNTFNSIVLFSILSTEVYPYPKSFPPRQLFNNVNLIQWNTAQRGPVKQDVNLIRRAEGKHPCVERLRWAMNAKGQRAIFLYWRPTPDNAANPENNHPIIEFRKSNARKMPIYGA